jgi:L-fucose mutarotase
MLKGVDPLLTPRLLAALAEMGHGDSLAIVDSNFPAHAHCRNVVDLPGSDVTCVSRAVLSVIPVDTFIAPAVHYMTPGNGRAASEAYPEFKALLDSAEERDVQTAGLERLAFYESVRRAYVVVTTTDPRPYACFLITKGVVGAEDDVQS